MSRAEIFSVAPGHAGLWIYWGALLGDGRPVDFTRSFYRGDAYDIVAELAV